MWNALSIYRRHLPRVITSFTLLVAFACVGTAAPALSSLWTREYSISHPQQPILMDVDADGQMEIIIVSLDGKIMAIEGSDGELIWETTLENASGLKPPGGGAVAVDHSFDLFVPDDTGSLHWVDGSSGNLIEVENLDSPAAAEPIVWDLNGDGREEVLVITEDARLRIFTTLENENRLVPFQVIPLSSNSGIPPSVGDVTGDGVEDIVIPDRINGVCAFSVDGRRLASWVGSGSIATPLTLVDLTGDGQLEVTLADRDGQLTVLGYSDSPPSEGSREPGSLVIYSVSPITGRNSRFTPLSAINTEGSIPGVIFVSTEQTVRSFDGVTGQVNWIAPIAYRPGSPTAVAPMGQGQALIALIDVEGNLALFDGASGASIERVPTGSHAILTPLIADFDGDADTDLFILSSTGGNCDAQVWDVGQPCSLYQAFWISRLGAPANSGCWTSNQIEIRANRIQAFRSNLERTLLDARSALEADERDQARALAQRVLSWDAHNEDARAILRDVSKPERQRRNMIIGVIVILLVAAGGVLFTLTRRKKSLEKRIAEAKQSEKWGEVVRLLAPMVEKSKEGSSVRLDYARALVQLERFDGDTIPLIEELAASDPSAPNRLGLARAYLSEGIDHDGAVTLFDSLIRSGHEDTDLLQAVARMRMRKGDHVSAARHLRDALRLHPDDSTIAHELCEAQVAAGQFDASFFRLASKRVQHGDTDALLCRALCSAAVEMRSVSDPAVMTAVQIALKNDPKDGHALICKGLLAVEQGQWEALSDVVDALPDREELAAHALALKAVVAVQRSTPNRDELLARLSHTTPAPDPRVMRHIAQCLAQSGERTEITRAQFEMAMTDPDCPSTVLQALAECLEAAGKQEDQAQVLARLAAMEPGNDARWREFGLLCARLRRTDSSAKEAYLRLLDNPPEDHDKRQMLLVACGLAGVRDPRMSELAEEMIAARPDDIDLNLTMIRLLLEQGATAEAHRLGLKIEDRIEGLGMEAAELVARAAFEAKDFEKAIPIYERLHAAQPDVSVWLKYLSISLSRLGRHTAEAIEIHRRMAKLEPDDPVVKMVLARALLETSQIDEGIALVRQAARSHTELVPQIVKLLTRLTSSLRNEAADPVRMLLADLLSDQGEFAEAASHLSEITSSTPADTQQLVQKIERMAGGAPNNADALQALGLLHIHRGEHFRAREVIDQALNIDPENTDAINLLVRCEEKIVAENDTAENRLRLGECQIRAGMIDAALANLQPIQEDVFLYRPIRMALTRAYIEKRMLDLAWQTIKALSVDEQCKPLLYDLGGIYLEDGEHHRAQEVWCQLYSSDIGYRDIRDRYEGLVEDTKQMAVTKGMGTGPVDLSSIGDQMFRERFELEEEVGSGGMGRVYRALDKSLEETVALKILPPEMARNSIVVERLKSEVRAARRLTHPNIIRIHDFGDMGEQKFISMEFIDGPTLKYLIRTPPGLTWEQKILFARQMADGFAYAHRQGIIHRDIKPANILIAPNEQVKITDYGIAKVLRADAAQLTSSHQVIGTPLYMSPEQIRGESVDGRADIYSYGVTLYEMLIGMPPFTEGDLTFQHLTAVAPRVEGVSDRLAALVAKCMEKDPENRPGRFEEISDDLAGMDETDFQPSTSLNL